MQKSYTMSTSVSVRECPSLPCKPVVLSRLSQPDTFIPNIDGCVDIAIMMCATTGTYPFADTEVFDHGVLTTAAAAKLAAGVEPADLNDLLAIPCCLILKLAADLAE